MPVLKINGQQFSLQPGQNRLGGGTTADVAIGGAQGVLAIVDLGADGRATIRKAGTEPIRVNGTSLQQPAPLIHGDKVEIAGSEVYFADDVKQGGSTQFVSAADVAAIAQVKARSGPARGTLNTGGRLVSLVDGKEYPIPEGGITIGRDATADIVVAQTAVSRRHAQVIASGGGYIVNDLSTNGVFVNGEKATSGQALSRADVIRVGTEEFRFYADLAPISKAAAPAPAPAAPPPAAPVSSDPTGRVPTVPPSAPPPAPPAAAKPASPPTPPARPAAPPPAAPAAKPAAAKTPTPPARPATPAPAPASAAPATAPVTTKKGVPTWAALVVILAVAAVAAYVILVSKN